MDTLAGSLRKVVAVRLDERASGHLAEALVARGVLVERTRDLPGGRKLAEADALLIDMRSGAASDILAKAKGKPALVAVPAEAPLHEERFARHRFADTVTCDSPGWLAVLRLRNVVAYARRTDGPQPPSDKPIESGPLRIEADKHMATWMGRTVQLTPQEHRVLRFLAAHPGRDISIETLTRHVVPAAEGHDPTRNLRSSVKRLRNRLRAVDPEFDAIRTYYKFGYRWEPPVAQDGASDAA